MLLKLHNLYLLKPVTGRFIRTHKITRNEPKSVDQSPARTLFKIYLQKVHQCMKQQSLFLHCQDAFALIASNPHRYVERV